MRRKVTKEEFKKVLDTLFPWGYTGNVEKGESEWFLGWAYINQESHLRDVMSVNMDGDGIVFWLIQCNAANPDMATGAIDGMMHALLPGMVADNPFDEKHDTMLYQFPECHEEERPSMTDNEKAAADIVNAILEKGDLDHNKITDILLDDYGECVHVTFTGCVACDTIKAIGEAFGDPTPHVYSAEGNAIRLVISNESRDDLKD